MPGAVLSSVDRTARETVEGKCTHGVGASVGDVLIAVDGYGHCCTPLPQEVLDLLYTPARISASQHGAEQQDRRCGLTAPPRLSAHFVAHLAVLPLCLTPQAGGDVPGFAGV